MLNEVITLPAGPGSTYTNQTEAYQARNAALANAFASHGWSNASTESAYKYTKTFLNNEFYVSWGADAANATVSFRVVCKSGEKNFQAGTTTVQLYSEKLGNNTYYYWNAQNFLTYSEFTDYCIIAPAYTISWAVSISAEYGAVVFGSYIYTFDSKTQAWVSSGQSGYLSGGEVIGSDVYVYRSSIVVVGNSEGYKLLVTPFLHIAPVSANVDNSDINIYTYDARNSGAVWRPVIIY